LAWRCDYYFCVISTVINMSASCAPNRDHPTNHPVPNHATMSREPSCDEKLGYSVVRTGDTMMALATAALSMASSEGNGNNEEVRDWNWKNSSKEKAALAANETNASSDVSMHHDDRLGEELGVQCLHLLKFSRSIHDLAKAEVPTAETQRMASGGIPSAYVPIIPPIDDASMASGRLHRPGGAQEQRAAATRMRVIHKARSTSTRRVKKGRGWECSHEGCTSHAKKGGVCVKHGAKITRKNCSREGCTKLAARGGVCIRHGATVPKCSHEGCTNHAKKGGVCVRHGANVSRKFCSHEGCTNRAKKGGVCARHGATRTLNEVGQEAESNDGCNR